MTDPKHPMQPVARDAHGVVRFKPNAIVQHLLDHGGFDMNSLAMLPFSDEDHTQFAQLIGYSVSGFGDLDYVPRDVVAAADAAVCALREAVAETDQRVTPDPPTDRNRPEHVKCVALDVGKHHPDYGYTWCGRADVYGHQELPWRDALATAARGGELITDLIGDAPPRVLRRTHTEFHFVNAAHALVYARNQGRLLICRDCAAAMLAALYAGCEDPEVLERSMRNLATDRHVAAVDASHKEPR
jgi:hypothetical protein